MAHPTLQARVGRAPSFFAHNSYASQKMVVTDVLRDTLHQIAEDMHPQLDPLNMYDHVSVRMQKSFLRGGAGRTLAVRAQRSFAVRAQPPSTSARDDARSVRSVRSGYSRRSVQASQAPDPRELAVREARPEADGSRAEWPPQPEANVPRPPSDARSQHVPKDQPMDQPPAHKSVRLGDGGSRSQAPKAFKSSKSRTRSVHPRPPRHDKPSSRSIAGGKLPSRSVAGGQRNIRVGRVTLPKNHSAVESVMPHDSVSCAPPSRTRRSSNPGS